MSEHQVDAVVIGAGPGGYHAAIRLGQLGKKVICIDRDEVGGVCLNWGCIPTKALLHVGEVIRHIEHADAIGLKVAKPDVDRDGVAKFKTDVVNANVGGVKTLFKANGVEFLYGEASFVSPTEVLVKKRDGGSDTIKAADVVIATGSAPVDVKAWPRDGETIVNSDDAVNITRIPKKLLVIGGGVIGLEFATVYARMGAEVLVVEMMPQILTGTDLEIAKTLGRIFKKQGVEIMLDTKVGALEKDGKSVRATLNGEGTGGKDETREFDMVLVAVGRRPVTDNLNLRGCGSRRSTTRVSLLWISRCARKSPNVFAIGDVTGQPLLAHRAMKQGVVAAEVIAGNKSAAFDPVAVPNCVYTDPEVATVGLSEEEAKAKGFEVRIGKFPLAASGRARTMNESDGMHQTRRRCEERSAARHAHRRAASGIVDRRRRHRARDGRDARGYRALGASTSDAHRVDHGCRRSGARQSDSHRQSQAEGGRRSEMSATVTAAALAQARLLDLGTRPYRDVWDLQHHVHEGVRERREPDTWIVVEHPPSITLGRQAKREHVLLVRRRALSRAASTCVAVERGGDVTYHGPGQLVVYPIRRLARFREVVPLVRELEGAVIAACARFGVGRSAGANTPACG